MRLLLKKVMIVIMSSVGLLLLVIATIMALPSPYNNSMEGMFVRQYEHLKKTESPKYIYVSGSSGCFGIDANLFEQNTRKTLVNMGNYAGYENDFVLRIAVENAHEGDVILLAYENTRWLHAPNSGDLFAQAASIDIEPELLKYWSYDNYVGALKILPTILAKKVDYIVGWQTITDSTDYFDQFGNFIGEIQECSIPKNNSVHETINCEKVNEELIAFVKGLVEDAQEKGVQVMLVAPPTLREATVEPDTIDAAYQYISEMIGCIYISNANDHLFEREYMGDSIWHCNKYGREKNTSVLIDELEKMEDE